MLRRAFTLIELLVVITLMAVAVSVAALKLDGLTDTSRLRSAANQIASVVRLTKHRARIAGTPRLIEYALGTSRITVRAPRQDMGSWVWDDGQDYVTATGVRIERVLVEGDREDRQGKDRRSLRIGSGGRHRAHAVALSIHDRSAVVVLRGSGDSPCRLLESRIRAETFRQLMLELERIDREG